MLLRCSTCLIYFFLYATLALLIAYAKQATTVIKPS